LELYDMPALICRQGCAVGRVGYHVYPIRHSHLRISVPVQHLGQGTWCIGLEMAQLKPGLPGVDSGFVSNEAEESITLLLEGGERVRHLGPHRLHGKRGIDSDEYSPGMAREVQMIDTAQHPIQA